MTTAIETPRTSPMAVASKQELERLDQTTKNPDTTSEAVQEESSPPAKRQKGRAMLVSSIIEQADQQLSLKTPQASPSLKSAESPILDGPELQMPPPASVTKLPHLSEVIASPLLPRKGTPVIPGLPRPEMMETFGPSQVFGHAAHPGRPNIMTCVNPSCKLIREPCGCIIPLCVLRSILDPKNLTPPCSAPISPMMQKSELPPAALMAMDVETTEESTKADDDAPASVADVAPAAEYQSETVFKKPTSPASEKASPDGVACTCGPQGPPSAPRLSARRLPFPLPPSGATFGHRRYASAATNMSHLPFQSQGQHTSVPTAAAASCAFQRISGSSGMRRGRTISGPAYLGGMPQPMSPAPLHGRVISPGRNVSTKTRFSPPFKKEDRERLAVRFADMGAEPFGKRSREGSPSLRGHSLTGVGSNFATLGESMGEEVDRLCTPEKDQISSHVHPMSGGASSSPFMSSSYLSAPSGPGGTPRSSTPLISTGTPPPFSTPKAVPFTGRNSPATSFGALPPMQPMPHPHHLLARAPRSRVSSCFHSPFQGPNRLLPPLVPQASRSAPNSPALGPHVAPVCTCPKNMTAPSLFGPTLHQHGVSISAPPALAFSGVPPARLPRFRSISVQQPYRGGHGVGLTHHYPFSHVNGGVRAHPLSQQHPVVVDGEGVRYVATVAKRCVESAVVVVDDEEEGGGDLVGGEGRVRRREEGDGERRQRRRRTVSAAARMEPLKRGETVRDDVNDASLALVLMANS
ncbi:hypothetical protein BC829DRAFT_447787 [Chytridium lagenaria]|nr:hypothetical protein BC829DRAFT_447787 [Chytridium lagenaria]